ncbi:MAG: rhomboid family intramembrane serine protease [Gracilibacteraceae bacterium]|jgi:rhomboid protease GluP|nr:rhomboid family intramembrane serine protease [Gracilibacteraceae bacterium]
MQTDDIRKHFITYGLIAACAVMFILLSLSGGSTSARTLVRFGANVTTLVQEGEYWRFFTSMFLHIGIMHLLFNAYALLALGRQAEYLFGHGRFLAIYIGAGLGGSWLSFFLHRHETMVAAGASGAVFGVLGALLAYGWRDRAFWRAGIAQNFLVIIVINFAFGMMPGAHIDNSAHLGGLLTGILLGAVLRRRRPSRLVFPSESGEDG